MPIQWRHVGEDPETGRWEVKLKGGTEQWRARKPDGTDLGLYDSDWEAVEAVEEALGGSPADKGQEPATEPHKSEKRAQEAPKGHGGHKGKGR